MFVHLSNYSHLTTILFLSINVQYFLEENGSVEVMRTQADEKMKSTEQIIIKNRSDTAKTIHAERSLSKATNDKLKNRATTTLSRERIDYHAKNMKKNLAIANLKGLHSTQVAKMNSKHLDVKKKSVEELWDLKKS